MTSIIKKQKEDKHMNTRLFSLMILLVLGGLTSCGDKTAEQQSTDTIYNAEPVKVTTQQVGTQITNTITVLSGNIQSKNKATVSARMTGYVTQLNVNVGDKVSVGQTIIKIENNELPAKRAQVLANIAEAEAAQKNVKINYDRMKALWEKESITRKEWDDISSQYEMVKAKVTAAREMYNEVNAIVALTSIKAPISGVITSKMINMGDLVNPGVPLMSIEGNKGYEVVTYVSDNQISAMKLGMILDCHIKAIDKNIKAKVTEISPSAVNTGGQFVVKAALHLSPSEKNVVFPGMYANVQVDLPTVTNQTNRITIEKSALIERGQLTGIYTVSNQNTALLRWIRVGKDLGGRVEVVSGLKQGEEYVVGDLSNLVDGIPVTK